MKEKLKKYKYFIIGIIIIAILIPAIMFFNSSKKVDNKPGPMVSTTDKNKFDPNISKINVSNLSIGNMSLDKKVATSLIAKPDMVNTIRAKGVDFEIRGFSMSPGGDSFTGGGCRQTGVYDNYILNNNEYYEVTLKNIYAVFKPKTKDEFISMVNYFYALNPTSCGIRAFIYDGVHKYTPDSKLDECNSKDIDIGLEFSATNSIKFVYFSENLQYPITLFKTILEVKDQQLEVKSEEIFSCKDGIQF